MRFRPGPALLLLLGLALALPTLPTATAGGAGDWHASYDVEVRDGADGAWRAPTADDPVPDHWEWWSGPGRALDARGQAAATTAFHQAFWFAGANWTNQSVTHVAADGSIVRSDATTWGPVPDVESDLVLNNGATSANYMNVPVATQQTVQASRFGTGPLPCGQAMQRDQGDLLLSGSCLAWPAASAPESQRLRPDGSGLVAGQPADAFSSADGRLQAWVRDGEPVPVRIQSGDLRLDLVGLRRETSAAPAAGPDALAATPWDTAPLQPWGLDESGLALAFPAQAAYEAALASSNPSPLRLFLLQHPAAKPFLAAGSSWEAGERVAQHWDFLLADDAASWTGNVTREVERGVETVTATGRTDPVRAPLPHLDQLPSEAPTAGAVAGRWSAWSGVPAAQATFWRYETSCGDASCRSAQVTVEAGHEQWHFPSQRPNPLADGTDRSNGTTDRAAFSLDGLAVATASSDWRMERPPILTAMASQPSPPAFGATPAPRLSGLPPAVQVAAGVALTAALAAALWRVVPLAVGLYARIRTDALPQHPTRAAILDLVTATPGLRYSDLLATLGCGKGTLEHHLGLLERGGHVVLVKRNGLATYFRTRQAAEGHAMAWLRSTTARRILGLLADGAVAPAHLHRLAGCSRSTAHHHLVRIEAAGLARRIGTSALITPAGRSAWESVRDVPQPT